MGGAHAHSHQCRHTHPGPHHSPSASNHRRHPTPTQVLRAFEWETGNPAGRRYKFDVLITTYEMVIKDSHVLRPIRYINPALLCG